MNPWRMPAIGMALVLGTALVTGLVIANWAGPDVDFTAEAPEPDPSPVSTLPSVRTGPAATALPTASAIQECNRLAAQHAGNRHVRVEVANETAVGTVVGAGASAQRAGKAVAGGVVGGTLFGLDDSGKHDERYRAAYSQCLRSRGYAA